MELNHITDETCRVCNAIAIIDTKEGQHANGQWRESREFNCGAKIRYSPNFGEEHCNKPCPNSPELLVIKEKREIAMTKLRKYIKRLQVDKEFKDKLLYTIKYM